MANIFKFSPPPSELYDAGKEVVQSLVSRGHKAFMVGGCIRDAFLDIAPSEYDITTSATPDEITDIFSHTVPVGASFGVVLVIHDEYRFEVATFRKDLSYSDGRHPDSVIYSADEKEDVTRRDFTINALLYDPFREEIMDYVGAVEDFESRTVRSIGNPLERFREDKLRMLRAIRFSARFDYSIEEDTYSAVKQHASHITEVSLERIRDEVTKIASQRRPGRGLRLLLDSTLLTHILPEVAEMDGVPQPPQFHPEGDVFTHTCLVLDELYQYSEGDITPELAMGALLHDVGKPTTYSESDRIRFNAHDTVGAQMAESICRKLRFSKKQTQRITELVRHHLKFKDALKMRTSTLKKFLAMPHFEDHLALHYADCMASHGQLKSYAFIESKLVELEEEEIKPKPLLTGDDLIELGYVPGPVFREILRFVEEAQLEGVVGDKEGAKALVREKFPLLE
ncbi:MAG: CCA tRNA nucleotidyltransferase [Candidatus Dadabacteria bacterium]|nr:CCA tRNA nucleotidyltransferase [Candidatus Dadabacteria bacterium]